ncbi:MAG: DUF1828 domain-containing protein [Thiocapsa sp.]|uniref:DUF1828 domain-containing protein n=1 Tax=Thiocapsa sp. TaxID=2024551 RepID=UPI001BD03D96|nr:DUF1828 domain-containing protein [Thiocapsa sp.]QVL50176.1 MAG: DUF1828 domain-containing protein [Thiocapsa sp.]
MLTDVEFSALLDDRTKRIPGDILWLPDERVRTPFLYPDGDNIDLFVQIKDGIAIVSDLGETLRWLRSQTLSPRRTPKQNALIADACITHGIELFKGMLVARCKPGDSVATVIMRVAQACLRISDLWFTFRTRAVESVNDEVGDFLSERQLPFERRPKLVGRSGRGWTVDFHVMAPAHGSLVSVLSTGSRSTARAVAEHVLAAWFDLNHFTAGPEALRFVSLFDDTADVWSPEDFILLEPLSTVTRWSQPDVFADVLADAA